MVGCSVPYSTSLRQSTKFCFYGSNQVDHAVPVGQVGAVEPSGRNPTVQPLLADVLPRSGDVLSRGVQTLHQVAVVRAQRCRQRAAVTADVNDKPARDARLLEKMGSVRG